MNFTKLLKNTDLIEVSYHMGFEGEPTPTPVCMHVEAALIEADKENQGHCHDGYAVFHIGEYECSVILGDRDEITGFTVSHLADVKSM